MPDACWATPWRSRPFAPRRPDPTRSYWERRREGGRAPPGGRDGTRACELPRRRAAVWPPRSVLSRRLCGPGTGRGARACRLPLAVVIVQPRGSTLLLLLGGRCAIGHSPRLLSLPTSSSQIRRGGPTSSPLVAQGTSRHGHRRRRRRRRCEHDLPALPRAAVDRHGRVGEELPWAWYSRLLFHEVTILLCCGAHGEAARRTAPKSRTVVAARIPPVSAPGQHPQPHRQSRRRRANESGPPANQDPSTLLLRWPVDTIVLQIQFPLRRKVIAGSQTWPTRLCHQKISPVLEPSGKSDDSEQSCGKSCGDAASRRDEQGCSPVRWLHSLQILSRDWRIHILDDSIMIDLAAALTKQWISAFRFDFSGNGESEGEFQFGNYNEADGLHSVISYLYQEKLKNNLEQEKAHADKSRDRRSGDGGGQEPTSWCSTASTTTPTQEKKKHRQSVEFETGKGCQRNLQGKGWSKSCDT